MVLKKSIAISETGFIFNPATGDSYTVNPIAAEILQLLKAAKSLAEIKQQILQQYDVDAKTLEEDLSDFSSHLQQLGLAEHEA